MAYSNWNTTPGNNNMSPPHGFPEGMAASTVNNSARQLMADLAQLRDDVESGALFDSALDLSNATLTLAAGVIDTDELAADAVTAAKLADDAVTTDNITDANVTAAKLASNAVTTAKITDANVTTAKIADDAVTADKLAHTAVTPGSYTNVSATVDQQGRITAMSSGSASNDVVLIESITLSSDSSVEFLTDLTTYSHYRIEISNVVVSNISVTLTMQISADGGSTYNAVAYDNQYMRINNGTVSGGIVTSTGSISLTPTLRNTSGNAVSGYISFGDMSDTTGYKHFNYRVSCWENGGSGDMTISDGAAWRKSNAAINAIKFAVGAGSMTSGTITLYGYRTS